MIDTGIAVHPDGRQLASTGTTGVRLWETTRGRALGEWHTASAPDRAVGVQTVAYSPDGRWLAGGGEDARIYLWDAATGNGPKALEGSDGPVNSLTFSPDSRFLASASATGQAVTLWSMETLEPVLLIPDALDGCTVEGLVFHPRGRLLAVGGIDWLATGGSNGAICLWDLAERCEVATFAGGITSLAMHPTGRWLAAASLERSICIWDLESRKLVQELPAPEDPLRSLTYSPDGHWLAGGGDDRTLRFWRGARGRLEPSSMVDMPLDTQIKSLGFAPDGHCLYTGNGNTTCYKLNVHELLGSS
jgi:WD40 repeat protein